MVSLIRDYLDVLSSSTSYFEVAQVTFSFLFQALVQFVQYFLTFGWFRDILYLPVIVPKCQQALMTEHFIYQDFNVPLFESISEASASISQNSQIFHFLVLGFLNSLFCALPFSVTHFFALRRLFVQGLLAGIVSTAGVVLGQSLFLCLTIFGVRSLIIPWFSFQPFNFILGITLVFLSVYSMANEKRLRPIDSSETNVLITIFVSSFLLTWTEQGGFAQYLSTLNFSNSPSLLELPLVAGFSHHLSYAVGFFLGHVFFSGLLIAFVLYLRNLFFMISGVPFSILLKKLNSFFLIAILGLSFNSIPYYGFDYLLMGPLGFISKDIALEGSYFTQEDVYYKNRLFPRIEILTPLPIDLDYSYFDRGDYGLSRAFFKRIYEDLNYQGEFAWVTRFDKKPDLYSSGQTTRLSIQNYLKLDKKAAPPTPPPLYRTFIEDDFDVEEKSSLPSQMMDSTLSMERSKMAKRFYENYEEDRERDMFGLKEVFFELELGRPIPPILHSQITIKEKYYGNPVYRALLNFEIDTFSKRGLGGQSSTLSASEEISLFELQELLSGYHDTIRSYQKLPYYDEFEDAFQGSKTFVDRTYKHQFKGTLSAVRRLFAISPSNEGTTPSPEFVHFKLDDLAASKSEPAGTLNNPFNILRFDQPLFIEQKGSGRFKKVPFVHEEMRKKSYSRRAQKYPLMELNDSSPFYYGWDNESRRMILTKRFLPSYSEAPTTIPLSKMTANEFTKWLAKNDNELNPKEETLLFTTWPIPEKPLFEQKILDDNPLITLFEPATNPEMAAVVNLVTTDFVVIDWDCYSFPGNMRYYAKFPERLEPQHGGLVWPGTLSSPSSPSSPPSSQRISKAIEILADKK